MLIIPATLAGCGEKSEATAPDPWQGYRDSLDRLTADGRFAGAVLVARDDRVLLSQGYGLADRRSATANSPRTRFCVASLGKMFTAVAIAQLVERRRLAFTDHVSQHLPGFPFEVTVHHLLTHTSGLGDEALRRTPGTEPPHDMAGMMRRIVRQQPQFEPGTRFGYSNDGFIVLGALLERLLRRPYPALIEKQVFHRAWMSQTTVRVYRPSEVSGMAHPYLPDGRDVGTETQIGNPSGGAISTTADLLAFSRALAGHRLLSPAMTRTVLTGQVDSPRPGGPAEDRYAYGFSDQRVNGVRIVGHNGGTPGYEAQLDIYPDRGHTVVVLANLDRATQPAIRLAQDILTAG